MRKKRKDTLEKKKLEFLLDSKEYKETLKEVCLDIIKGSETADNEATVVSVFELEVFTLIKEVLGLKYYPEKEKSVSTERHVAKGRIDSKIGALVIEFKQPSSFNTSKKKQSATSQIIKYLEGLYVENETDYLGIVTDGIECQVVNMVLGKLYKGSYEKLNYRHLDLLIRNIVLLDKVALTPENLVKDFCSSGDSHAQKLTLSLYATLKSNPTNKTIMLFQEWKELFSLAHDDKSKQKAIEERRTSLESVINEKITKQDEEYLALYAIQTTYAIIVKIIAYKVISKIRFNHSLIEFNALAEADSESLRIQMDELEDGAIFRSLGIGNLLEGDFFSWYSTSDQWNSDIGNLVRDIFIILTPYEDKIIFDTGDNVKDLFKNLFMSIVPDKVRHSLGEFYTPPWLADNLITEAIIKSSKVDWKGLDPCSGSGTFLTILIKKVLEETKDKSKNERLYSVLSRVKGIDLNPLAVLTARINYFINISHLISDDDEFEIPVYLGDSSYVPKKIKIGDVNCLSYEIQTIEGEIEINLPKSIVKNTDIFSKTMTSIENDIHNLDKKEIVSKLLALIPKEEQEKAVVQNIKLLAKKFVELEKNDWNGIWARIITNFLTTANLGVFDIIVGNPPWIDWKNLPEGYRERIKALCVDRHLFSGDGVTGGINLNVCALISNVCAQNWLEKNGTLGFLMPQSLIFQQSYEGFRNFELDNNERLYLQEIYDWTKSGHPFKPVQHKFLTYFFSDSFIDYTKGINAVHYKKIGKEPLSKYQNVTDYSNVSHLFKIENGLIGHANKKSTVFSYTDSSNELSKFKKISGSTKYRGREGVEFYPQELYLLELDNKMPHPQDKVFVKNYQNKKSKYKIPEHTFLLETKYLHPLIKGVDIERFHLKDSKFIVPFPYDEKTSTRSPFSIKALTNESPLLSKYFNKFKQVISAQTDYNSKIIGEKHNNEFYAVARVGEYSFAKYYVAFRDNTKWQAVVVTGITTPWGEKKRPQFQNHAVSICQDDSGRFIELVEAHYICAIINAPVTKKYILNSSDSRSFKIRLPIHIPPFNKTNFIHKGLSELSVLAHKNHLDLEKMSNIDNKLDSLVVKL